MSILLCIKYTQLLYATIIIMNIVRTDHHNKRLHSRESEEPISTVHQFYSLIPSSRKEKRPVNVDPSASLWTCIRITSTYASCIKHFKNLNMITYILKCALYTKDEILKCVVKICILHKSVFKIILWFMFSSNFQKLNIFLNYWLLTIQFHSLLKQMPFNDEQKCRSLWFCNL